MHLAQALQDLVQVSLRLKLPVLSYMHFVETQVHSESK